MLPPWGTDPYSLWGALGASIDHMTQSHPHESTRLEVTTDSPQKLVEGYWEGDAFPALCLVATPAVMAKETPRGKKCRYRAWEDLEVGNEVVKASGHGGHPQLLAHRRIIQMGKYALNGKFALVDLLDASD